jgi:ParB family transcriptional regulator, chromosome partitioning protein
MTKPKGLGRGLDALLGAAPVQRVTPHPDDVRGFPSNSKKDATSSVGSVNAVALVAVADIEANPNQPRREFDEHGLRELAESINAHGIIQPITLRKVRASKFQIISGERRFRAAQRVGLTELPAYIREADDRALLEMALVENIQRQDLNPLEVSMSFQHLMEECGMTQDVLSSRVGMARSSVANYLRMLELPVRIQDMLRAGSLSLGHAKALAGVRGTDAPFTQVALAEKAVAHAVSVRELERWVKQGGLQSPVKPTEPTPDLSEDEIQALDMLRLKLSGTHAKLSLKRHPQGGGQLTLKYRSVEELEAVMAKLGLD